MKRKKNKSPQQLYQPRAAISCSCSFSPRSTSRLPRSASIFISLFRLSAYMLALTGRVFLEYSDEGSISPLGLAFAVLVLVPYLLCWIFSKKRRGG